METVEIEIVIKIPKNIYDDLFNKELQDWFIESEVNFYGLKIGKAIQNGTVLPKGHGRLIDADAATKDINAFQAAFAMYTDNMGKYNIVCAAPTIIETDKVESGYKE